jgi:Zn-finger nucleic acid-binding protein
MAHKSVTSLDAKTKAESKDVIASETTEPFYYALDKKRQWQGPFRLPELAALPWFSPRTWISTGAAESVERASENVLTNTICINRLSGTNNEITTFICPVCKCPLITIPYEKTTVYQCKFCSGILVENEKIPRIIARREKKCTDRVKSLAIAVQGDNFRGRIIKLRSAEVMSRPHLLCGKCRNPMLRMFYSLAYLIEVDRCNVCGVTWFDTDELEMLQCIIENKIMPKVDPSNLSQLYQEMGV